MAFDPDEYLSQFEASKAAPVATPALQAPSADFDPDEFVSSTMSSVADDPDVDPIELYRSTKDLDTAAMVLQKRYQNPDGFLKVAGNLGKGVVSEAGDTLVDFKNAIGGWFGGDGVGDAQSGFGKMIQGAAAGVDNTVTGALAPAGSDEEKIAKLSNAAIIQSGAASGISEFRNARQWFRNLFGTDKASKNLTPDQIKEEIMFEAGLRDTADEIAKGDLVQGAPLGFSGPEGVQDIVEGNVLDPDAIKNAASIASPSGVLLGQVANMPGAGKIAGVGLKATGKVGQFAADKISKAAVATGKRANRVLTPAGLFSAATGDLTALGAAVLAKTGSFVADKAAKVAGGASRVVKEAGDELLDPDFVGGAAKKAAEEAAGQTAKSAAGKALENFVAPAANVAGAERMARRGLQGFGVGVAGSVPTLPLSGTAEEMGRELITGGAFGALGSAGMDPDARSLDRAQEINRAATVTMAEKGAAIPFKDANLTPIHERGMQGMKPRDKRYVDALRGLVSSMTNGGRNMDVVVAAPDDYAAQYAQRFGTGADPAKLASSRAFYDPKTGTVVINQKAGGLDSAAHEAGHFITDQVLGVVGEAYGDAIKKAALDGLFENGKPIPSFQKFINRYNELTPGAPISADATAADLLQNRAIDEYLAETTRGLLGAPNVGRFALPRDVSDRISDSLVDFFGNSIGAKKGDMDRTDLPTIHKAIRDTLFDLREAPAQQAAASDSAVPGEASTPTPDEVNRSARYGSLAIDPSGIDSARDRVVKEAVAMEKQRRGKRPISEKSENEVADAAGRDFDEQLERYIAALESEGVPHPDGMDILEAVRLNELAPEGNLPRWKNWAGRPAGRPESGAAPRVVEEPQPGEAYPYIASSEEAAALAELGWSPEEVSAMPKSQVDALLVPEPAEVAAPAPAGPLSGIQPQLSPEMGTAGQLAGFPEAPERAAQPAESTEGGAILDPRNGMDLKDWIRKRKADGLTHEEAIAEWAAYLKKANSWLDGIEPGSVVEGPDGVRFTLEEDGTLRREDGSVHSGALFGFKLVAQKGKPKKSPAPTRQTREQLQTRLKPIKDKKARVQALAESATEDATGNSDLLQVRTDDKGKTRITGKLDTSIESHRMLTEELGMSPEDVSKAEAFTSGQTLYVDYLSAKNVLPTDITGKQRRKEYKANAPADRGDGNATMQRNKAILGVTMSVTKNGAPILRGISVDKYLGNAKKLLDFAKKQGEEVGYKDINDPLLIGDLNAYVQNHQNGYRGDGTAPVKGETVTPGYNPVVIPRNRFDLLNAAFNADIANKIDSKQAKTRENAGEAQFRALENDWAIDDETGDVNPFRAYINKSGKLSVVNEKGETRKGTGEVLEGVWESLAPDMIQAIKDAPDGERDIVRDVGFTGDPKKAFAGGMPNFRNVEAGFMPGEGKPLSNFDENESSIKSKVTETPQFKKWFGDSKVTDESGQPIVMYHGTTAEGGFTEFKKDKIRPYDFDIPVNGFWFSSDKGTSPAFRNASATIPAYLSIKNPAPASVWRKVARDVKKDQGLRDGARSHDDETRLRLQELGYDGIRYDGKPEIDAQALERNGEVTFKTHPGATYKLKKEDNGVDLYRVRDEGEGRTSEEHITGYDDLNDYLSQQDETWLAFEPTQIKSATENSGDFDPSNPDIRFQPGEDKPLSRFSGDQATAARDEKQLARFMYGGETAKGFDKADQEGRTFRGRYDGKQRFEIDDSAMKLKVKFDEDGTAYAARELGRIIDHPELFDNYPEIANLLTTIEIDPSIKNPSGKFVMGTPGDSQFFGTDPEVRVKAASVEQARSSLVHELQHYIQQKEDFAKGGSPADFAGMDISQVAAAGNLIKDYEAGLPFAEWLEANSKTLNEDSVREYSKEKSLDYDQTLKEAIAVYNSRKDRAYTPQELQDLISNYKDAGLRWAEDQNEAFSKYQSLSGEIEARDVEARLPLSKFGRKQVEPYSSENVPREKALTRFMPGESESSIKSKETKSQTDFRKSGYHNGVKYDVHAFGPKELFVNGMWADKPGAGMKFLKDLTAWADDNGVTLRGDARPMRSRADDVEQLPKDKLQRLYRMHGFTVRDNDSVFRSPNESARFQPGDADELGFTSTLAKVVSDKLPNKASVEQVRATLDPAKSGIKKEELEWMGLDQFLEGKKTVTKQELQDFIEANRVELKEVVKGSQGTADVEAWWNDEGGANEETPWSELSPQEQTEATERYSDEVEQFEDGATKFSQYKLPGGENYREVLLTLPSKAGSAESIQSRITELRRKQSELEKLSDDPAKWTRDVRDELRRLNEEENKLARDRDLAKEGFRSNHWDEPNVLAHTRQQDLQDAEGNKVRVIEEFQSDWHQKGRKEGYAGPKDGPLPNNVRIVPDEVTLTDRDSGESKKEIKYRVFIDGRNAANVFSTAEAAELAARKLVERMGVPDAPFKKSWHELAFKRALRQAVEDGSDKMAWVTGEIAADRFDLSKQLNTVKVTRHNDGFYVDAWDKSDSQVMRGQHAESPEALAEMIGKELAEKVITTKRPTQEEINAAYEAYQSAREKWNTESGTENEKAFKEARKKYNDLAGEDLDAITFAGLDLKVGGQGMKGFYDKIIPDFARKYVKKWGGKVETVKVQGALEAGRKYRAQEWMEKGKPGFVVWDSDAENVVSYHDSMAEAKAEKQRLLNEGVTLHSITITPEMRESVMGGQPMFMPGDEAGAVDPADKKAAKKAWLEKGTDSPWFRQWFGKSKVTDDNGKPLTVYSGHAQSELYGEAYDPKKTTAGGFYATEDPDIASNYSLGKFGAKESFEQGSQYRFQLKNGKFGKKIWQMELTPEQQQKVRDFFADEENGLGTDLEKHWKDNAPYDADSRRGMYRGLRDLQSIFKTMESLGYNIAYPEEDKAGPNGERKPFFMRQRQSSFEDLLDHLGIKWRSYERNQPGVQKLYLKIENPIDADKPFPEDLLAALDKASKRDRNKFSSENTQWTTDYPLKQWVQDIKDGDEYWSTHIPAKALPIIKQFGYDGIKERGSKGAKTRAERQINWIAFDPEQIKSAVANQGTFDESKPSMLAMPGEEPRRTWFVRDGRRTYHKRGADGKFRSKTNQALASFQGMAISNAAEDKKRKPLEDFE